MIVSNVSAYANVTTRVRGMIGELLGEEILARLNTCPDLNTLLSKLGETSYGQYLTDTQETLKSSRRAAYEIRKKLSRAFETIIHYGPKFARPLLTQSFKIYEVDNLKAALRGIEIGEGWDKIRYMLFPMENFPTLPFEEMVRRGTIEGAIQLLHNTDYERELKIAYDRYQQEQNLFPLEVALDLNYWRMLWDDIDLLPKNERTIAHRLIGMMVDKNNIMWAARYRIYHHLSESEIINYTLPFGYKINDSVIRAIAADRDPYQLVTEIYPAISVEKGFEGSSSSNRQINETILTRLIYTACRKTFAEGSFNIGLLLAYLFVLEMEIQDLTLLLEAKALGIPSEVYTPCLIHNLPHLGKN